MGSRGWRARSGRPAGAATWWREAVAPRWLLLSHLRSAGVGLVAGLLAVNLLLGLLPVGFVVLMSIVVGRIPAAVGAGPGSPEWESLVGAFTLASLSFIGQQLLTPAQTLLGELMQRNIDGHVHDRLLGGALRSTGIGPMEDPETLDALKTATLRLEGENYSPGAACAGSLALLARYLQLTGFVVLLGVAASWFAAVIGLLATMTFRYGQRGGLRKYSQVWTHVAPLVRRGEYLRDLATGDAAAKEIRIFGLSGWLADRYHRAACDWLAPVWRERRRIYLVPYFAYTAVGLAAATLVLVLLAYRAVTGDISLTALAVGLQAVVAALMLGEFYPEADVRTQFGMLGAAGLRRFERRTAVVSEPAPGAGRQPDPAADAAGTIRFEGVWFAYPHGESAVLDGLDLELAAGRCTALVGLNGSGKTTIVKLLCRLHEPGRGIITAGGTDLRAFDVDDWRRRLSVVFQDFVRYELSAAENIRFGAPHARLDDAAVRRVADRAGILEALLTRPRGLATPLASGYPGGIELSGGQWQRVAIARSLYAVEAGARLLVLDEPTAALDVRAEAEFFERFVELTRGVTSLLISHRFSSVRYADRIVVLGDGRVIEHGTHEELLASGGRYAELFRLQAARFAEPVRAGGQGALVAAAAGGERGGGRL